MNKIKTALISVSDKKNIKSILELLKKNKVKIISSGGTYKEIKKLKFKCIEVSEYTNFHEILEGRVKTSQLLGYSVERNVLKGKVL